MIGSFLATLAVLAVGWTQGIPRHESTPAALIGERAHVPARLADVWPVSTRPTHRLVEKGVPDFGQLNAYVWRSGQPTREGYRRLKAMGLKTVVNLRAEFPQDRDLVPAGVRYVYVPVRDTHPPTTEQARQVLDIMARPENWPLLVHCDAGEGREGLVNALMRHSFDGWDDKRVMEELNNFRVRRLGFILLPIPGSQRAFIRNWEAATPPGGYLTDDKKHASAKQ